MSAEPKGHSLGALAKFVPHAEKLRRYLSRRRKPQDVDDLAHEVYLRLLQVHDPAAVNDPIKYLYGVAANVVADFSKETYERRHVMTDSDELARMAVHLADPCAAEAAQALVERQQLEWALHRLPKTHAQVLILHKLIGLSHAEVATELQLSPHTVEKYVVEAKAQLRALLWSSERR